MVTTAVNLSKRNQNGVFSSVWVFILSGLLYIFIFPVSVHARSCVPCPSTCTCEELESGTCKVDCGYAEHRGYSKLRVFPVPAEMPQPPTIVTELDIKENAIQTIATDAISSLTSLIKLDASNNDLVKVDDLFHNLTNLEELNLLGNSISSLSPDVFVGLSKLRVLILSRNLLVTLKKGAFDDLISLEKLSVNVMPLLKTVDDDLFSNCPLKELYLNQNEGLDTLPPNLFKGLDKLERLDISENNISSLAVAAFLDLVSIQAVFLHTNPWNCSCELVWLTLWLQRHGMNGSTLRLNGSVMKRYDAHCHAPTTYAKQPITSIQEINCTPSSSLSLVHPPPPRRNLAFRPHNVGHRNKKLVKRSITQSSGEKSGSGNGEFQSAWNSFCSVAKLKNRDCRGPEVFSSCALDGAGHMKRISFNEASFQENKSQCRQHCFNEGRKFGKFTPSKICLCGSEMKHLCMDPCVPIPHEHSRFCDKRTYLPQTFTVTVDISLDPVGLQSTQVMSSFSVTCGLHVDHYIWNFGVSEDFIRTTRLGQVEFSYFYPGDYTLTVTAVSQQGNESAKFRVRVREPAPHAELVCPSSVDVTQSVEATVLVKSGSDLRLSWKREDMNGAIETDRSCPSQWKPHRGRCLQEGSGLLSYDDATKACKRLAASMIALDHKEEMSEIIELFEISAMSSSGYLIGAQRENASVRYLWSSTHRPAFFSTADVIGHTAVDDCVVLYNLTLSAVDCQSTAPYICQTDCEDCTHGGRKGDDGFCYRVSESEQTWENARKQCETYPSGDLAIVNSNNLHRLVSHAVMNSARIKTAWIGLADQDLEGYFTWINTEPVDDSAPEWSSQHSGVDNPLLRDCVMLEKDGAGYTWIEQDCSVPHHFICRYDDVGGNVKVASYSAGTAVFNEEALTASHLTPVTTTTDPTETNVYIVPGSWFSDGGTLESWELITSEVTAPVTLTLLVLRPTCPAGSYIIQPGCPGYPSPISTCSSTPLSCNPHTDCLDDTQFCHLTSDCRGRLKSCTCHVLPLSTPGCGGNVQTGNDSEVDLTDGSVSANTQLSYRVIRPLKVNLSSSAKARYQLVDLDLSVEEGDVIGFQVDSHIDDKLLCNIDQASDWRQTVFHWTSPDWLNRESIVRLQDKHSKIDDVVCLFHVKFSPPLTSVVPPSLSYFSSPGQYHYSVDITGDIKSRSLSCSVSVEERVVGLTLIYPPIVAPGVTPGSQGTVALELRVETDFVIKLSGGSQQEAHWTHNPNFTGQFTAACPSALVMLAKCRTDDTTAEKPFSLVQLTLDTNSELASLNVRVKNSINSQTLTIDLSKALRIVGLQIDFPKIQLTASRGESEIIVPSNETVHFKARFQQGSAVTYSWTVDGSFITMPNPRHNRLSYNFSNPGVYTIDARASNILGEDTAQINITALRAAGFKDVRLVNFDEVVERGVVVSLTVGADVNPGATVHFTVKFGDDHEEEKSIMTGMSVVSQQFSHKYPETGQYLVNLTLSDVFHTVSVSQNITVVNRISSVEVTIKHKDVISTSDEAIFHIIVGGDDLGEVTQSWNFGDGTSADHSGVDTLVRRRFTSSGSYNVTVKISNGISVMTGSTWITVQEEISGLTLTSDGPKPSTSTVTFTLSVSMGSDIEFEVDLGDGNSTFNLSTLTFTHQYPDSDVYNVSVIARNRVSQTMAYLTVYALGPEMLEVIRIDAPPCKAVNEVVSFTVEVVNAAPIQLLYFWKFGDESVTEKVEIPNVMHTYTATGPYTVSVNVSNKVKTGKTSTEMCIQEEISGLTLDKNGPLKLSRGSSVKGMVTATIKSGSDVLYTWKTGGDTAVRCDKCPQRKQFEFTFYEAGDHMVTVTASNNVSNVTNDTQVTVQEIVDDLQLICLDCTDDVYLATNTMATFLANVSQGSHLEYEWRMDTGAAVPSVSNHSQYDFAAAGIYVLSLTVSNDVSSENRLLNIVVQDPVSELRLHVSSFDSVLGTNVEFSVNYSTGSDLTFTWNFCPTCANVTTTTNSYLHEFSAFGEYIVMVTATNAISEASTTVTVYSLLEISQVNIVTSSPGEFIPTGEVIHFTGEVNEQLKLNLTWTVMHDGNTVITEYDTGFQFIFPSAGLYKVILVASNPVSIKRAEKILNLEEKISGFDVITNSTRKTIPINSVIKFTARKSAGSHLQYEWSETTNSGNSVLDFTSDVAVVIFDTVGTENITCEVANNVSKVYKTIEIIVQMPVTRISIEVKPDVTAVASGTQMEFHAIVGSGTDLSYHWSFDESSMESDQSNVFSYTFIDPRVYILTLKVFNKVSQESFHKEITVQDRVSDLDISMTSAYVKTGQSMDFAISTSAGSNLQFKWTFNDGSDPLISVNYGTSHSFNSSGVYTVQLMAFNNISLESRELRLTVQDPVIGLALIDCCDDVILTHQDYSFTANTKAGTDVQFELWMYDSELKQLCRSVHRVMACHVMTSGQFSVHVTASNRVSHETKTYSIEAQSVIEQLAIEPVGRGRDYLFQNQKITFRVTGIGVKPGESFTCAWSLFQDLPPNITTVPEIDWTFDKEGEYNLTVVAKNDISSSETVLTFTIKKFVCNLPAVDIVGSSSRKSVPSRSTEFEASVDAKNCTMYAAFHQWKVFIADSCSEPLSRAVELPSTVYIKSPVLKIPRWTLPYGSYCVQFTTGYEKTSVNKTLSYTLTVISSPLVAIIRGGDKLVLPSSHPIVFDGASSYDPDMNQGKGATLAYSWTCSSTPVQGTATTQDNCFAEERREEFTVEKDTFVVGREYTIMLTVSLLNRSATGQQKIVLSPDPIPIGSIECLSCRESDNYGVCSSHHVTLLGKCMSCQPTDDVQYRWAVMRLDADKEHPVQLDFTTTTTGANTSNLVVRRGALLDGYSYKFRLQVTLTTATGVFQSTSSLQLEANLPPTGGTCTVSPDAVTALETVVLVRCSGWTDPDSSDQTLVYHVGVARTGPSSGDTESYMAYQGTGHTHSLYLARWSNDNSGSVTLSVRVLDEQGAASVALRKEIQLRSPILKINQTKSQYLADAALRQLRTLVKLHRPKALLQYATAVILELNGASKQTAATKSDDAESDLRAAIRDAISMVLREIPIESLNDVQQMAFALDQITMYAAEIQSKLCHTSIEIMLRELLGLGLTRAQQGLDSADLSPGLLLSTATNLIRAVNLPVHYPGDLEAPSGGGGGLHTMASRQILADIDLNYFSLSGRIVPGESEEYTADETADEAHRANIVMGAIQVSESVMAATLMTRVLSEQPITLDLPAIHITGRRTLPSDILSEQRAEGCRFQVSVSLLDSVSPTEEIFQVMFVMVENPFTWGYQKGFNITSQVPSLSFFHMDGSRISVYDLPQNRAVNILMFTSDNTAIQEYSDNFMESPQYDPQANLETANFTLEAGASKKVALDTSAGTGNSALHIQVRLMASGDSSPGAEESDLTNTSIVAYLGKDYEASENRYEELKELRFGMMETGADHRLYTFFVDSSSFENVASYSLTLVNTDQETAVVVVLAIYFSSCQYFDTITNSWATAGCHVLNDSIPTVTVCSCDHLTSFGGSTLVPPSAIDFKDLLSLDLATNPTALIICCVIVAMYLVLAFVCHRIDLKDLCRISKVPLCGRDGAFKYEVTVVTGRQPGAGTSAHVGIRLYGEDGKSGRCHLSKPGAFQRNCQDTFLIAHDVDLGKLWKVLIWHDNTGRSPSWYVIQLVVRDLHTDQRCLFLANSWLSLQMHNGFIQKEIIDAGPHEMQGFSHLWTSAASRGLADQHLWLSLFDRPAQSRFTRLQRLTCCFTLIFTYMAVNVMWYGVIKTTRDYALTWGWKYLSWEEIVVGAISSILVFPLNIMIAFIFRKTRCKDNVFEYGQKPQTAETLEIDADCGLSHDGTSLGSLLRDLPQPAYDRDSTTGSLLVSKPLRRTNTMPMFHREETEDSTMRAVAVRDSSSSGVSSEKPNARGKIWWSNDTILDNWSVQPEYREGDGETMPGGGGSFPLTVPVDKSLRMSGIQMKELDSDDDWSSYLDDVEPYTNIDETEKKDVGLKKSSGKKINLDEWSLDDIDDSKKWEVIRAEIYEDDKPNLDDKEKQPPQEHKSSKSVPSEKSQSVRMSSAGRKTEAEQRPQFNPREEASIASQRRRSLSGPASVTEQTNPAKPSDQAPREDSFDHASIEGNISFGRERTVSSIRTRGGNESMRKFSVGSRRPSRIVAQRGCLLPCWCMYLAYGLCLVLTAISILLILLYANQLGYEMTWRWVISLLLSFLLSAIVMEPLKVIFLAVYVATITKTMDEVEDDDAIEVKPMIETSEKLKDVRFKPLGGYALLQAREDGKKISRMHMLMRQFLAYFCLLWLVWVISYVNYNDNLYIFSNTVRQRFVLSPVNGMMASNSIDSMDTFWQWSEDNLALRLHDDTDPNLLLGPARFRQIRSVPGKCPASDYFVSPMGVGLNLSACEGDGGFTEDTRSYGVGWNAGAANTSWQHYTASQLDGHSQAGRVSWYTGGGYTQTLGTSLGDTRDILTQLHNNNWIDHLTRAVFVEFAVYNPSLELTTVATLLVEFPLTGKALVSSVIESHHLQRAVPGQFDALILCQVILLIVFVYFLAHTILSVKRQGFRYFTEAWNWAELMTTVLILASFCLYLACMVKATRAFRQYFSDVHSYANFHEAAYHHEWMRVVNAWLVFFLMIKVVKQLRFLKVLSVFERTLGAACGKLLAVFFLFALLLCTYAQLGYLMYGAWVEGFHSYEACLVSLVGVIRGTMDYEPLMRARPVLGHVYLYSYALLVYGVPLGLVLAILTHTYKQIHSQMFYKLTLDIHDYEMIDFMMKRFKLWAGITKPKPAFRAVKFAGQPSLSSHSTYSTHSSHTASQSASSSSSDYYGLDRMDSTLSAGHCSEFPLDRLPTTWENVLMKMRQIQELDSQEDCISKQIDGSIRDWKWKQTESEKKEALLTSKPPPVPRIRRMSDTINRGLGKFTSRLPRGKSGRLSVSPPTNSTGSIKKELKKRPFSDQGARERVSTDNGHEKADNVSIIGGKRVW